MNTKEVVNLHKGLRLALYFHLNMPTYLDAHDLGNMTDEQLEQAQNSPTDEFGVKTKNMLYNREVNMLYCILDAPTKDAVYKHHQKFGMKCDWITEVKTTA